MNEIIAIVTHQWAKDVADRIQQKWDNMSGIKGEAHINVPLPIPAVNTLIQTIEAWGAKSFIAEFGSGSESDRSNPYLDQYVNSSNFNHHRSKYDMTIRGRDAGEYTDLDGNPQTSTGHAAGRDLELKPVYEGMTMLPARVIETEVEFAKPELYARIQAAVGNYIKLQITSGYRV